MSVQIENEMEKGKENQSRFFGDARACETHIRGGRLVRGNDRVDISLALVITDLF